MSVSLRSEAMAVQHHAFKKRSALCSSSLSTAFLPADTSQHDICTSVSDIDCVTLTSALNCPAEPTVRGHICIQRMAGTISSAYCNQHFCSIHEGVVLLWEHGVCFSFHGEMQFPPKESLIRYSLMCFGLRDKWC